MGATYPDLYAAVGVHSGLAYGAVHDMPSAFIAMKQGAPDPAQRKTQAAHEAEALDLSRAVPTIVFHGDRDGTVNPRNGEQVLHQWAGGSARATVRRGQVSGGRAYTRSVYRDAVGRAVAERWIVHGAGHAWSGGSRRGSYTDPHGPDASAEMVRFFMENSRD
jgi:poly(3-hydroxybutyrate) depolymerase